MVSLVCCIHLAFFKNYLYIINNNNNKKKKKYKAKLF